MAEGYTSWECPDLNTTLYSCDYIHNPDSQGSNEFCPVVRPVGFNVMAAHEGPIQLAKEGGLDYNSGYLKIARVYRSGALTNDYLFIQIRYIYSATPGADRIRVTTGTLSNGSPTYTTYIEYDYDNYWTLPAYRKMLYVMRCKRRDYRYRYADLPGYTGYYSYNVIMGSTKILIGRWYGVSLPTYPYGHMEYTDQGYGDPTGCLLSRPCAIDNEESRSQQSEGIFSCSFNTEYYAGEDSTFHITDYNGDYNPDPDTPTGDDPNDEDPGGNSGPGGGDGDHRGRYDPIAPPGIPDIGPNSAGFVYALRLTVPEMNAFAVDLIRPTMWSAIKNFFADPMDFICGILIVPFIPTSSRRVYPKFGENIFQTAFDQVTQQYIEIDCGRLYINKYYGSCFDHNPYHRLVLWLPYIGYRELDPDEVTGKTLHIIYYCDAMTGDCVACLTTEVGSPAYTRVIAQYSGNCGVRVPFGAQSFDAAIAASVQLIGGAVGTIAGGITAGVAGMSAGNISGSMIANSIVGSTVQAVNGSKITTERSGVAGASAGYLSTQKPYILRTLPRQSLPTNYKDLEGYPSNIAGPLSNFSGYAAVEMINLNGIVATKEELNEIKSILAGGVYI